MAIGDVAASAGLVVYPSSQDARLGYQNSNQRGDDIARHMLTGGHNFTKITGQAKTEQITNKAVTGDKLADTVAKTGPMTIKAKPLTLTDATATDSLKLGDGALLTSNEPVKIKGSSVRLENTANDDSIVVGAGIFMETDQKIDLNGAMEIGVTVKSSAIENLGIAGPANVVISSAGTLGKVTSSKRFKKAIKSAPLMETLLDVKPKTFKAKSPQPGEEDRIHYGVIAEDLDALGLTHLVGYDKDGEPETVHYALIGVALIPLVAELVSVIGTMQERITKLEGKR